MGLEDIFDDLGKAEYDFDKENDIHRPLEIEGQINEFVDEFLEKQGYNGDDDEVFWIGEDVGGVLALETGHFFDFKDIIFDIKTNQPEGNIINWFVAVVEYRGNEDYIADMSYKSWCMNGNKLMRTGSKGGKKR